MAGVKSHQNMRPTTIILFSVLIALLSSCGEGKKQNAFVGTWRQEKSDIDSKIIILKNGQVSVTYSGNVTHMGSWQDDPNNSIELTLKSAKYPESKTSHLMKCELHEKFLVVTNKGNTKRHVRVVR